MKFRHLSFTILSVGLQLLADTPTSDDFLPPVRGGSSEVINPRAVKEVDSIITAKDFKDAINSATKRTKEGSIGFRWFKFKDGDGCVATGMASYQDYANPTATLIAQRTAYINAAMRAKSEASKALSETSVTNMVQLENISKSMNTADLNEQSQSEKTDEEITTKVEKLLKGFVTWEIQETTDNSDSKIKHVFVTIAAYPKSLSATSRSGGVIDTANLKSEFDELLVEIQNGIVPPVGGRIITVRSSGKSAWVGFGSAIVNQSSNAALKAKNRLTAQQFASARASASLLNILVGDQVTLETGIVGKVETEIGEATKFAIENSDKNYSSKSIKSAYNRLTAEEGAKTIIKSASSGKLPPGLQTKSWINDEGTWAHTVLIYYPDFTAVANEFNRKMDSVNLLEGAAEGLQPEIQNSKEATEKVSNKVKPLKGGLISPEDQ